MSQEKLIVSALALALIGASASAEDWPAWRGPNGTGISSESMWDSKGKGEALWATNVGLGYTSFVVSDNRVITAGHQDGQDQDTIFCFNATTGDTIWTHSYASKKHDQAHKGGSLTTPTIDGDRVYALGREGQFFCLNFADGAVIWTKHLKDEYDLEYPTWMFSASPLISDEMVIINVGRTIALDKSTGAEIWQTGKTGHAYSTPHPLTVDGRRCLAVFNSNGLYIYARSDGAELASLEWKTQYDINAATPIVMGNRIFISSGQNRGCAMLEFTGDDLEVLWENKSMANKMTGCVLVNDHLFGFDNRELKCIDLDGNEKWIERGLGNGTLMAADGRLIVITGKGDLVVADASPGGFTPLSQARVLEGGVFWTMPVLANGLIYCRNSLGDIVCRDHRSSSP